MQGSAGLGSVLKTLDKSHEEHKGGNSILCVFVPRDKTGLVAVCSILISALMNTTKIPPLTIFAKQL